MRPYTSVRETCWITDNYTCWFLGSIDWQGKEDNDSDDDEDDLEDDDDEDGDEDDDWVNLQSNQTVTCLSFLCLGTNIL